ncbi:MAG: response regulator [Alphaproteobacteria bacterium]|nr:response regulator [Alphaproteobacteria bacterium]
MRQPGNGTIEIGGDRLVMVVDDDPVQCEILSAFFRERGIPCVTETNSFAAVSTMKRRHPRVVIMDIRMPGLDGIAVAKLASSMQPKPVILLMSAEGQAIVEANRAGIEVFAVLEKPLPLKHLGTFIQRALDRAARA